jgi:ATP/maltotriose-dependent transcriptional regulator MalT
MKKKIVLISLIFLSVSLFCILFFHIIIPYVWLKVDEAFHKGRYDKAIEYLSFISYIQPKNSESYILKAWLQWSEAKILCINGQPYKEKLEDALKTFKEGQKENPKYWRLYFEEGIMWEAFDEKQKALKAYYISSKYAPSPYNKIYKIKSEKFKIQSPP